MNSNRYIDRKVELSLALTQQLPRICVDRTLLQQVIVNLSINAMQAMEQAQVAERRICITTTRLDVATLELVVEDNGPGIAASDLDRLFDSFFTTKKSGMGMGLPICRTVIQSHGGSIHASNNTQACGARFTVTLPVAG